MSATVRRYNPTYSGRRVWPSVVTMCYVAAMGKRKVIEGLSQHGPAISMYACMHTRTYTEMLATGMYVCSCACAHVTTHELALGKFFSLVTVSALKIIFGMELFLVQVYSNHDNFLSHQFSLFYCTRTGSNLTFLAGCVLC